MRARAFFILAGLLFLGGLASGSSRALPTIPSAPTRYFNDYALAVKPETVEALNTKLENFEKESSNQILVAILPRLETESSIEDYTHRIYAAWHPGQAGRNNGAVLFVFLQNKKMRIETGRGLEGALPDARARQIIGDVIAPLFRAGDYDGGMTAGVDAMIASVKGEYQGGGQTAYQKSHAGGNQGGGIPIGLIFLLLIGFFLFISFVSRRQQAQRPRGGMFTGGGFSPIFLPMGGGGGGGFGGFGGGGGGDSGGGGGGFLKAAAATAAAAAARAEIGKHNVMKARDFIAALDHDKVVAAIAAAEAKTCGQIRVYVTRKEVTDVLAAARVHFAELKMEKTAERNAALLLFAPRVQKFAVFGDTGIHEKCGDHFWQGLSGTMRDRLRAGDFTGAIVLAVESIGAVLAEHFPPRTGEADRGDELPNEVVED